MNFHYCEKQIFKSFRCTKIRRLKMNQNVPKRSNATHPQLATATHDQFFLTMSTTRQILTIPLLVEEALITWSFQR